MSSKYQLGSSGPAQHEPLKDATGTAKSKTSAGDLELPLKSREPENEEEWVCETLNSGFGDTLDRSLLTKDDVTYTTSLLGAKKSRGMMRRKQRSSTAHLSALSDGLGKGLRKRGETLASAVSSLHPKSSIARPMLHASEYMGEASVMSCVMSMTNSVIGAGILTLPYCMAKMGAIPGVAIVISNAFLSGLACFFAMLAAKTVSGGTTFSDIGWKTLPRVMGFIDFLNFLGNFGTLVAYLVVIGDVAPDAFKHVAENVGGSRHSFFVGRTFMISMFSVVFLLPTISASTFDNLKYVSLFAVCCFTYIVCVTVLYALIPSLRHNLHEHEDTGDGITIWPHSNPIDFCSVISIVVLAFSATQNAVSLTHELRDNSVKRIALVCFLAFSLCSGIYVVVGLFGFSSFGNETESDILLNYPSKSWLVTVLRISLAIAVSFTYPMWLHPTRENVAFLWLKRSSVDPATTRVQYHIITYGLWFVSFCISLVVNDLGLVMGLIGSVGIVGSVFTVPGLLFYYRCTPAGGPDFYSPTGNVHVDDESTFASFHSDDSLIPKEQVSLAKADASGDDATDDDYDDGGNGDAVDKTEGDVVVGSGMGPEKPELEAWNVWPKWTSYAALTYAIGGIVMVPIMVTIQLLSY